jgi:hypothetical protein
MCGPHTTCFFFYLFYLNLIFSTGVPPLPAGYRRALVAGRLPCSSRALVRCHAKLRLPCAQPLSPLTSSCGSRQASRRPQITMAPARPSFVAPKLGSICAPPRPRCLASPPAHNRRHQCLPLLQCSHNTVVNELRGGTRLQLPAMAGRHCSGGRSKFYKGRAAVLLGVGGGAASEGCCCKPESTSPATR